MPNERMREIEYPDEKQHTARRENQGKFAFASLTSGIKRLKKRGDL